MIRRIVLVISIGLLLVVGITVTAGALPGEGFEGSPYGVEDAVPRGVERGDVAPDPGEPATRPVPMPATDTTPITLLTLVLSVVAAAAVMAVGGWVAGASHHRRVPAH